MAHRPLGGPLSTFVGATRSVGRDLAVEPDRAWEVLADTRYWPAWGPSVTGVELHRPATTHIGPGVSGRVRTAVGVWLPFRVTEWEQGRSWAWIVGGVAATGHRVDPAPGGCRVSFEVPIVAAPYLLVCQEALRRIDRLARPSPDG